MLDAKVPVLGEWDIRRLRILVVAGFVLRVLLVAVSAGSNDILSWEAFARDIQRWGILAEYRNAPLFNHPPLMGWWSVLALEAASRTAIPFHFWFKLPLLIADAIATRLAWSVGRRHGTTRDGWLAAAVFATGLVSIWITSHHGNTDSVCALFVLVGAWFLEERGAPFLAGLSFAAALNVKLIPVAVLPALLIQLSSLRALQRFCGGLALGLLPFAVPVLGAWDAFYRNALQYGSGHNRWGLRFFLLGLMDLEIAPREARVAADALTSIGPYVVMVSSALVGWRSRYLRLSAYHAAALAFAAFLVCAPGFGVQYLVYPFALLVVCDLRRAALYGLVAGVFAMADYLHFARRWLPLITIHDVRFPWWVAFLGLAAWLLLVEFLVTMLARRRPLDAPPRTTTVSPSPVSMA